MSAPEMSKEEVERIRGRVGKEPYTLFEARCDIHFLLTTLDAVQRERDDAVRNQYAVVWEIVKALDLGTGGCPDSLIIEEVERLRAHVQALEVSLHSTLSDLGAAEQERDALRAEAGDLRSQLAQRQVSVPFPYQRDTTSGEEGRWRSIGRSRW